MPSRMNVLRMPLLVGIVACCSTTARECASCHCIKTRVLISSATVPSPFSGESMTSRLKRTVMNNTPGLHQSPGRPGTVAINSTCSSIALGNGTSKLQDSHG
jgi:hypothetical protein